MTGCSLKQGWYNGASKLFYNSASSFYYFFAFETRPNINVLLAFNFTISARMGLTVQVKVNATEMKAKNRVEK